MKYLKLFEAFESFDKVYTQEEMKDIYESLTSEEKEYTKKDLFFDFELVEEPKEVITMIDDKQETKNTAKPGDYIITGSKGEQYVLSSDKFKSRYDIVDGKAKTKPVKILAKEWNIDNLEFVASWGEKMIIENGDFLVNNNGEFYRIEKGAFHNTYE